MRPSTRVTATSHFARPPGNRPFEIASADRALCADSFVRDVTTAQLGAPGTDSSRTTVYVTADDPAAAVVDLLDRLSIPASHVSHDGLVESLRATRHRRSWSA